RVVSTRPPSREKTTTPLPLPTAKSARLPTRSPHHTRAPRPRSGTSTISIPRTTTPGTSA
ncbi:hypothetical protein FRC00_007265, partial [Tulasnella sp. 408]